MPTKIREEYDLGVVTCHPIVWMFKMCCVIWHTWMFCRKNNLPCDKWIGVYFKGKEKVVAHFGCLPTAEDNARFFIATKKLMEQQP